MSGETGGDETKVFNDPIHGHIELHPLMVKIIDTPQFQRLRYIKQMGGKYYVFPGASHNRFEHSIGVGYLAGELVETIQKKQKELKIDEKDVLCVKIAGLCHDLGHGPFSHVFERFIKRVQPPERKWKHEDASVMMFKHLLEENHLKEETKRYGLDESDLRFIEELILGETECKERTKDKWFLAEIVANKVTEVDVDKWDYFARDCHGLGIPNNFDMRRYMTFVRVIPVDGRNQICVRDKEVYNLYEMFHARYTLYRRAYLHKTAIAVEEMLIEALVSANDHLRIPGKDGERVKMSGAIDDPCAYTRLTDDIVSHIFFDSGESPQLEKARCLLTRIEKRQLYKLVHHIQWKQKDIETDKLPEDIIKQGEHGATHTQLTAEDLHAVVVTYDYGMKEKNPVDATRFYRKSDPNKPIRLSKEEVSQMLPEIFSETELRLYYVKLQTDKFTEEMEAAKEYFEAWSKRKKNSS